MGFWKTVKEQDEIPLLDTKYLVKWLKENDFVKKLTNGHTHAELVRGTLFLRLL